MHIFNQIKEEKHNLGNDPFILILNLTSHSEIKSLKLASMADIKFWEFSF